MSTANVTFVEYEQGTAGAGECDGDEHVVRSFTLAVSADGVRKTIRQRAEQMAQDFQQECRGEVQVWDIQAQVQG